MKKFLVMLLMFVGVSGSIWADNNINTYVIDNKTASYLNTNVGVTTIYPKYDRILGFQVLSILPSDIEGAYSISGEYVVALFDAISGDTLGNSNLYGEIECAANSFADIWFPYPKEIVLGVTVRQGPLTRVIIYYVRG